MRTTVILIIMVVVASLLMWKAKKDPIVFETSNIVKNNESISCNDQVCLELRNLNISNRSFDIYMTNSEPVFGFQCDLPGAEIVSSSNGLLEKYEYQTSSSKSRILSFSMEAIPIPVGSGNLVTVNYNNPTDVICMTEIIFAGVGGARLTNNSPECIKLN